MGLWGSIIAIVFGVTGLGLSIFGIVYISRALGIRNWLEADGEIITSEINIIIQHDFMDTYRGNIVYEYSVDGKLYKGSDVYFGVGNSGTLKAAEKYIASYPENSPVTVIYNPVNPANSVLERKISAEIFLPLVFGIIICSITFSVVLMVLSTHA